MQGIRVPYLVQADATCLRATTEPAHPEPVLHNYSVAPACCNQRKPEQQDPAQPKKKCFKTVFRTVSLPPYIPPYIPGIYGLNSHISPREVTAPFTGTPTSLPCSRRQLLCGLGQDHGSMSPGLFCDKVRK